MRQDFVVQRAGIDARVLLGLIGQEQFSRDFVQSL
jgi:hypothetical protein